jgi:hypothetical protein
VQRAEVRGFLFLGALVWLVRAQADSLQIPSLGKSLS